MQRHGVDHLHERCDCCSHLFDDVRSGAQRHGESEGPARLPIASRVCSHTICLECALNVHLQEEAKSEHGSVTCLPWMSCPICHASYAFNADKLDADNAAVTSVPPPPPLPYSRTVSTHAPMTSARTDHHGYHYGPTTPYHYSASHSTTAYVSPAQDSYTQRSSYSSWQTMDYSPRPHATHESTVPLDFRPPPPHQGLSPPDIRRLDARVPPRYPTQSIHSSAAATHSPVSLPRKRLRTPISRSVEAKKAASFHVPEAMSEDQENVESRSIAPSPTASSSSKHWLTCRICHKPVLVTCQRLLSGPSPDHEQLWPQVRLGKRLAAALRQHNQQHHPDWFMWNVKGRVVMPTASPEMDEDDAVAQAALIKALEASFEHLPHNAGVDDYETKSAFLSRTLRRIGFAYAYISYTSSEWTKWQQWKKDCYSRVQIQAKARQLLDKYECNLKDAIDDQWPEISSLDHQEKLDLFQNIFVLPQCIFECLDHGRLPMRFGDVTEGA